MSTVQQTKTKDYSAAFRLLRFFAHHAVTLCAVRMCALGLPDHERIMSTAGSMIGHEIRSMYGDEEIDGVLARVDEAIPKCYLDHLDDTEALAKLSHQAVAAVRKFREEVLAKTKEALGERDVQFLDPGDGPAVLQEALGRVLSYTEARSRLAIETARWDQMIKPGTGFSPPPAQQQPTGKPLTYSRLSKELTVAVRLHVERVVDAAEVRRSSKL